MVKIMQYAKENEPEVTKYCLTVPQDAADKKSIYAIEEYADQATFDAHCASTPVQDLFGLFSEQPPPLEGAPTVYMLEPVHQFTRPESAAHENAYMLFQTLTYRGGTVDEALEAWRTVCEETLKDEAGTLCYNILKDTKDANKINTFEVYESEGYLSSTRGKSQAVQDNMKKNEGIQTGRESVSLRRVDGYLFKQA
ncbi:hypothetical protein LTS18_003937 [Coniosporium uncinatum]|uniref:Uncharacterized protein n=1 Tax=Coniosporium uncinatum TaxID=93489 RepID=A0ACC3D6A2_9PEZI|nr:hypothetical protein LTS18_003937 [Coniosporium uncinatum]